MRHVIKQENVTYWQKKTTPIEQDPEMVQMLELSDRAFKITEKHIKGSSGKVV